jgi:hypothetical protein
VLATYENVLPDSNVLLSKEVPSSEVTVCAVPSLLFHTTVLPFLTVVFAGKDIPVMLIVLPFEPDGVELSLDLEQEFKIIRNTAP